MYSFELWLAQKFGLIKKRDRLYCLTEKGAYYYHFIEQAYTTAYIDKMWNNSRLTAFPDLIEL